MAVEIESLFTSALGLSAPWRVANVELNTAQKRIDFTLTCDAKYLPCPLCRKADQSIHDHLERHLHHLASFSMKPGCTQNCHVSIAMNAVKPPKWK